MIVRLALTLDPFTFAEKYPMPHVVIGHYNPHEQIDEEGTGQPSYFKVLRTCQNGLSLAGECTFSVDMTTATIKLSYALVEDGRRARLTLRTGGARQRLGRPATAATMRGAATVCGTAHPRDTRYAIPPAPSVGGIAGSGTWDTAETKKRR